MTNDANNSLKQPESIDWQTLIISISVILLLSVLLFLFPERGNRGIEIAFQFLTQRLGWLYIGFGIVTILFLIGLALSPYRNIQLGPKGEPPRYSGLTWAGMLFSTGIGTALLYWGTIEWIDYYLTPPFDIEPKSTEAHQWAMSYGMFHWGLIGWGFYALSAVCFSHAYYVRKESSPSLANACAPILKTAVYRWPGRLVNAMFMIGLIGSASTGLGLTTPLITESFKTFFGLEPSFGFTIGSIVLIITLIALSVSFGLDRGIKRLSNCNLILMFAILGVVYFSGPTLAITKQGFESITFMVRQFPAMSGIYYPGKNGAFTESWTVFYWAWWIAFGPFVGMFISKISGGRTLGQLIWGVLGYGTLGCMLCFIIFGGYASILEHQQSVEIIKTFNENRHAAVVQVMTSLPLGQWILPLFFLLCISFAATTYDSASYTLALAATRSIRKNQDPARWHRVLWAITLGILPLSILSIGGQSQVLVGLQTISVVVSIPMLMISILMTASFIKSLAERK